ncbi:MAG: DUF3617 family protein [Betaproteobacteria bacterium]
MTTSRVLAAALAIAALASAAPLPAAAADYPTLRNGQWELTTTNSISGGAPRKMTLCLDASTQKAMLDMSVGMQKELCNRSDMRREGSRYITDAECKLGESVIKSHGVMAMTGDTAYRFESSATYDPPLMKDVRESKSVIEGRHTGACRDGLQPGDMVTPGGRTINLNQLPRPPAQGK